MGDGVFASKISATRDDNLVTNPIFVQISDGTDSVTVTAAGELNVILGANSGVDIGDVDVTSVIPGTGATNLGKAVDDAGGATDTGIAMLAIRDDVLTTLTPIDGNYVRLRVNSTGALHVTSTSLNNDSIQVDDAAFTPAVSSISMNGYFVDETATDSVDEGDGGAARMTADRKQLFVLVDATTDSQRLEINAAGQAQVDVAAHALTNANAIPISKDNSANAELNPIFVKVVDTIVSASEFDDFKEDVDIASDGTGTHTFTASNTTLFVTGVDVSGSGAVKFEIKIGPAASTTTRHVGFITGKEGDLKQWRPPHAIEEAGLTPTVEVIKTNRQGSAVSIYSTVYGQDV